MQIFKTIAELRQGLKIIRDRNLVIGLVPTMGNLHPGHLSLVAKARLECDFVLTTVFINPTQFAPNEDLDSYPRTLTKDKELLIDTGCDAIFVPSVEEIYPKGPRLEASVAVPALSKLHCGASRPGHFDGVCTVVTKLFNICRPNKAYFGEKDYQQLTIIKKMVESLNNPIEIISVETEREASGLAMSSRNNFLSDTQKAQATVLYKTLKSSAELLSKKTDQTFNELESLALKKISSAGLKPDYFNICSAQTLLPAEATDSKIVILTAAYLGKTRLIDNIQLTL